MHLKNNRDRYDKENQVNTKQYEYFKTETYTMNKLNNLIIKQYETIIFNCIFV